jgi:hypothetical protein
MGRHRLKDPILRARKLNGRGVLPVVVFDVDSTLLDTNRRNLRILREFAAEHGSRFAGLADAVDGLVASDMGYDARDTLRARGFVDPALLGQLFTWWYERFFSDEYVREDEPAPGAAEYVGACHRSGAHIYYLTARHVGGMEWGTARSLVRHGFPLFQPRCTLHMKPSFKMRDSEFKDEALAGIRSQQGEVVAFFENEPSHANRLLEELPKAMGFLRLSVRSSTAVEPDARLVEFRDFLREGPR